MAARTAQAIQNTSAKAESVTLSEPTKEGADFAGWYDNAALSGERIESISYSGGAKTLYACMEALYI